MISVPYTWTGIIIDLPGQIPYHPPTIDGSVANYTTTEDPNGRYQNTKVEVEYTITSEEEAPVVLAQTRAKEIAVALTHNESMAVPYTVTHRQTGEVVYRSNKDEFKIDENARCPICFSRIKNQNGTGVQTWDNDPIKTPNGLAGLRFQGFQQIALSDMADIQERNIARGMVGTKFESYTNPDGIVVSKRPVQVSDIIDLRIGTESIIGSGSTAKSNYFKYDELGRDTGSTQSDWTDPQLVANTFSVRALHVEDLRHPLYGWVETWESAYIQSYGNGDEIQGDNERTWAVSLSEEATGTSIVSSNLAIKTDIGNQFLEASNSATVNTGPSIPNSNLSLIKPVSSNFEYSITANTHLTAEFINVLITGPYYRENINYECYSQIVVTVQCENVGNPSDTIYTVYFLRNANFPDVGTTYIIPGAAIWFYLASFDNFDRNIYNDISAVLDILDKPEDYYIKRIFIESTCVTRNAAPVFPVEGLPSSEEVGDQSLTFQLDNIRITG